MLLFCDPAKVIINNFYNRFLKIDIAFTIHCLKQFLLIFTVSLLGSEGLAEASWRLPHRFAIYVFNDGSFPLTT